MLHERSISEPVALERDVTAIVVPDGNRILLSKGSQVTIQQELGGSYTVRTDLGFMARIDGKDADAIGKEVVETSVEVDSEDAESVEKAIWAALRTCYDPEIPVNVVELGLIYDCRLRPIADVPADELLPSPPAPPPSLFGGGPLGASATAPVDDEDSASSANDEEIPSESSPSTPPAPIPATTGADMHPAPVDPHPQEGFFAEVRMTLTAPGCGMGPVLQQDVQAKVEAIDGVTKVRVEVVFDPPWSYDRMSEAARLELGML